TVAPAASAAGRPEPAFERSVLAWLVVGLVAAYGPTWWDFTVGRSAADAQGHEVFVLAIAGWLVYRQRAALSALSAAPRDVAALALFAGGMLLYVCGRSQNLLRAELVSMIVVLAAVTVGYKGWAALRLVWFPLAFLLFVIPLPYGVVM